MKKQTILARSKESLEGIQAPETIITRHLVEVSRSIQGVHKYLGALYEIKRPALIETAHYYKTDYTEARKYLGTSAVQPVAQPMLRLVKDAPRPQNLLNEEIIIDHVLLEQLAAPDDVTTTSMPVTAQDTVPETVVDEVAPLTEAQAKLYVLRSEISDSAISIEKAYYDLTKAA